MSVIDQTMKLKETKMYNCINFNSSIKCKTEIKKLFIGIDMTNGEAKIDTRQILLSDVICNQCGNFKPTLAFRKKVNAE